MRDDKTEREFMVIDWIRRVLAGKTAPETVAVLREQLARMPLLAGLDQEEGRRLSELAGWVLRGKNFSGQDGARLSPRACASVALQMALPAMNLGKEALEGWSDVVLYPSPFVARDIWMDGIGLQHESESVLIGQARQDGPVILSLPDARASEQLDGWNVVIHEIAHKLDMLNGIANGSPPLHKGMNQTQWSRVWSQGYRQLCRMLDRGVDPGWLDPYAAENPAEYFAVLSEAFFELPHHLRLDLPEIYEQLKLFYRQDPAVRLPEPAWEPAPEA